MTFDIGLHEVCVRVGVRYVITKFSRMDSLHNFLTHGAPLRARELRYKGERNVSANKSETVGHKDLRLGKIIYILVFYNISFSWLLPLVHYLNPQEKIWIDFFRKKMQQIMDCRRTSRFKESELSLCQLPSL